MQSRPYTRFAYAISVIPEGQGGGRTLSGIPLNEACQICRDDLLVRNPLKIFAVQEMWSSSFGWTRENIWKTLDISEKVERQGFTYFVEDVNWHPRKHRQICLLVAFYRYPVLVSRFGGPDAFCATRLVGHWCSFLSFFIFVTAISRTEVLFCRLSRFTCPPV